jgi:hypothetical protein
VRSEACGGEQVRHPKELAPSGEGTTATEGPTSPVSRPEDLVPRSARDDSSSLLTPHCSLLYCRLVHCSVPATSSILRSSSARIGGAWLQP